MKGNSKVVQIICSQFASNTPLNGKVHTAATQEQMETLHSLRIYLLLALAGRHPLGRAISITPTTNTVD